MSCKYNVVMEKKRQSAKANILQLQGSAVGKYRKLFYRKYKPNSHRIKSKYKEQNELREKNKSQEIKKNSRKLVDLGNWPRWNGEEWQQQDTSRDQGYFTPAKVSEKIHSHKAYIKFCSESYEVCLRDRHPFCPLPFLPKKCTMRPFSPLYQVGCQEENIKEQLFLDKNCVRKVLLVVRKKDRGGITQLNDLGSKTIT